MLETEVSGMICGRCKKAATHAVRSFVPATTIKVDRAACGISDESDADPHVMKHATESHGHSIEPAGHRQTARAMEAQRRTKTLRKTIAAGGLTLVLGISGLAAPGFAQSQDHGGHGIPMEEPDPSQAEEGHDTRMEEMHGGEAAGGEAAQAPADDHDHPAQSTAAPSVSSATAAYRAANLAMHEAMDIEFSDDADLDFARGMIAHHEGAIEMARIVLEHGKDPELRQLAEKVILDQEAEVAFLRGWLAQRGD